MDHEMRADAELLNTLCNEAPLVTDRQTGRLATFSRQTLSRWTGLSVQTISDYTTGKHNIPIDFWRRVLEHHVEPRIFLMLFPDDGWFEVSYQPPIEASTDLDFFRQALQLQKKHNELLTYILDILADNRIDELDAETIERYRHAYHSHRLLDAQMFRSIGACYDASKAGVH